MAQSIYYYYCHKEEEGEVKGPYSVMQHLGSMPYSKLAPAEEAFNKALMKWAFKEF